MHNSNSVSEVEQVQPAEPEDNKPERRRTTFDSHALNRLRNGDRVLVNLTDPGSKSSLRVVCRSLFDYLWNQFTNNNRAEYAKCCMCFVTRASKDKTDHLPDMIIPLKELFKSLGITPQNEKITNLNTLFRFIEKELGWFPLVQQYQPGLNRKHDPNLRKTARGRNSDRVVSPHPETDYRESMIDLKSARPSLTISSILSSDFRMKSISSKKIELSLW